MDRSSYYRDKYRSGTLRYQPNLDAIERPAYTFDAPPSRLRKPPMPPPAPTPSSSSDATGTTGRRSKSHKHRNKRRSSSSDTSDSSTTSSSTSSSSSSDDSSYTSSTSSTSSHSFSSSSVSGSTSDSSTRGRSSSSSSSSSDHRRRRHSKDKVKAEPDAKSQHKARGSRLVSVVNSAATAAAATCAALLEKEKVINKLEADLINEKRQFAKEVQRRVSAQRGFESEDAALEHMQRLMALEEGPSLEEYLRRIGTGSAPPLASTQVATGKQAGSAMNRVSTYSGAPGPLEDAERREVIFGNDAASTPSPAAEKEELPPHISVGALSKRPSTSQAATSPESVEDATVPEVPTFSSYAFPAPRDDAAQHRDRSASSGAEEGVPSSKTLAVDSTHRGGTPSVSQPSHEEGVQKQPLPVQPSSGSEKLKALVKPSEDAEEEDERGAVTSGASHSVIVVKTAGTQTKAEVSPQSLDKSSRKRLKVHVLRPRKHLTAIASGQDASEKPRTPERTRSTSRDRKGLLLSPAWQEGEEEEDEETPSTERQIVYVDPNRAFRPAALTPPPPSTWETGRRSGSLQQPWAAVPQNWPCRTPPSQIAPGHLSLTPLGSANASTASAAQQSKWYAAATSGPMSNKEFKNLLCAEYTEPAQESPSAHRRRSQTKSKLSRAEYEPYDEMPQHQRQGRGGAAILSRAKSTKTHITQNPPPPIDKDPSDTAIMKDSTHPLGSPHTPNVQPHTPPPPSALVLAPVHGKEPSGTPAPAPTTNDVVTSLPILRATDSESVVEFPPPPQLAVPDMPPPQPSDNDSCCGDPCCAGDCCAGGCCACLSRFFRNVFCCGCCEERQEDEPAAATTDPYSTGPSNRYTAGAVVPVMVPATFIPPNAQVQVRALPANGGPPPSLYDRAYPSAAAPQLPSPPPVQQEQQNAAPLLDTRNMSAGSDYFPPPPQSSRAPPPQQQQQLFALSSGNVLPRH